jgi:hypothetical protein
VITHRGPEKQQRIANAHKTEQSIDLFETVDSGQISFASKIVPESAIG